MKKDTLNPSENAYLLALSGAVMIYTSDKHFVILTPTLAHQLLSLESEAEKAEKDPFFGVPYKENIPRFGNSKSI